MKHFFVILFSLLMTSSCTSTPSVKIPNSQSQSNSTESPSSPPKESQEKLDILHDCNEYFWIGRTLLDWPISFVSECGRYSRDEPLPEELKRWKQAIYNFEECLKRNEIEINDQELSESSIAVACAVANVGPSQGRTSGIKTFA